MIVQYGLMLDRNESSHPYLVKEQSLDYACDCLNKPELVVDMLNKCFHLSDMAEEYTYLVVLDAAGHTTGVFELSHGTLCEAPIGPRELFVRIFLSGGACFCLAHNHPSTNPTPSESDRTVARRIQECSEMMELKMADFLILGGKNYFSFKRKNLL